MSICPKVAEPGEARPQAPPTTQKQEDKGGGERTLCLGWFDLNISMTFQGGYLLGREGLIPFYKPRS